MKILMLSWNYPPEVGGIENVIGHLHAALARQGARTVVLTRKLAGAASLPVPDKVMRSRLAGVGGYLLWGLFQGMLIWRELQPEAVLCGSLLTLPVGWVLARLHSVPLAVIAYGSELIRGGTLWRPFLRWWLRRPDRVIAISHATETLLRSHGVPAERISVIPPGIDPAELERPVPPAVQERWEPLLAGRRVLLSTGRLVRRKGFIELVRDVMPRVVERYPDALLLIVGSDPTSSLIHHERLSEELTRIIRDRSLESHVRLLGRISSDDLLALMRRSELFLLLGREVPGDLEGFGIVFLEAAVAGVPSISTRVGGIPDAVVHGVTGWLVDPQDINGFSVAVCRLLSDDEERKRLGEAARKRARERFNWDTLARAYQDTLAGLIRAGRRKSREKAHG